MKKPFTYAVSVLLAFALLVPTVSSAQGTEATIAALIEQIKQLQAQISALQIAQQTAQPGVRDDSAPTIELTRTLREGAQGDDVRTIQALLALDPAVYPEGVISGRYGRMTTNAVKRFQIKHGLEPVGSVDAQTLRELNELLDEGDTDLVIVQSSAGTVSVVCHRTPPGHFVAPGWMRKKGGRPVVPDCQTLPPGIAKKLQLPETILNDDVTPPVVSVTSPFGGATVSRNVTIRANATDNLRVAGVQFLVDNSFAGGEDVTSPYTTIWNSRGVTNGMHTVVAVARDSAGNRATSSPISILVNNGRNGATPPQQDTTAPQISNVVSSGIGNTSATISFTTNESATTRVYYSTVSPVVITTAPFQEQSGFRTSHTVTLPQLAAGTTYHVLIVATDAVGNMTSMPSSFTTLSPSGDMSAPLISSVVSTAVVSRS
jgi:hypothetical protein